MILILKTVLIALKQRLFNFGDDCLHPHPRHFSIDHYFLSPIILFNQFLRLQA